MILLSLMLFLDFWTKFGEIYIIKHCPFQKCQFESQSKDQRMEKRWRVLYAEQNSAIV